MAATWDPVKKRYVDDGSTSASKGAMANTGYRAGEEDYEAQARKQGNAANAEAASIARHQEVKGSGLGTAGENAMKAKETTRAKAPVLTGKDQLEAMRKRRQSLTSY